MSNSEVMQFRHEQFGEIRTLKIDGEPWLVGKDVALSLGYTNSAKAFKHWVTAEVLPPNRRNGAYLTAETLHKTISDPRELAKLLNTLADEKEKRQKLEEENAFLTVKAWYYDQILNSKNSLPVTQIAKDYGMSAVAFNKLLHELRIQFPIRNSWVLYAEYAEKTTPRAKPTR